MEKNIAYKGKKFTIEWYFDQNGKSEVFQYFLTLPDSRKDKLFYLFKHMADLGKILNKDKFRYEGDQIYEFKPSPDRFMSFFFKGSKIIVTNAFEKKTQKLPKKEKLKALKYMNNYKIRVKEGTYYE